MGTSYDTDFYDWALTQAALLREGRLGDADILNIAEEIESMGRSEKRELVNRLAVLLKHLLKWQMQPAGRCTSWRLTIEEQRSRLESHLADNPSLTSSLSETISAGFRLGLLGAARETGLEVSLFPHVCPWIYDRITDAAFWPD